MRFQRIVAGVGGITVMSLALGGRALGEKAPHGIINTAYRLEIEFESGRSEVKRAYDKDIRQVADDLKDYPYAKCEIRGYTDNVGSDAVNLEVSQRRADSVRKYLIDKFGISPERLTAHGFGKADPVASNKTDQGRRQNRRIVAVIHGQPPGNP